jgi:hypothetical protein
LFILSKYDQLANTFLLKIILKKNSNHLQLKKIYLKIFNANEFKNRKNGQGILAGF